MPYLALTVVALWLGSLVHLILSVSVLFSKFPRLQSDVAIEGAPAIFHATERYHLVLAILALLLMVVWRIISRVRVLTWAIGLLTVAAALAVMQIAIITPRLDAIAPHIGFTRTEAQRAEFDQLHHLSSFEYVTQTVLVFTAFLLMPLALRPTLVALPPDTARGSRPD